MASSEPEAMGREGAAGDGGGGVGAGGRRVGPQEQRGAGRLTRDEHPMQRWRNRIDEQLEAAMERGEFENLPGAGKPLDLQTNVYAGERALAYSILKSNNVAPPEIERGKEIDEDLRRAEQLLGPLRHARKRLLRQMGTVYPRERRAYNVLRDKTLGRYETLLREVNSKVLSLNIMTPAALHRRQVDVEQRLRAFAEEFPRAQE